MLRAVPASNGDPHASTCRSYRPRSRRQWAAAIAGGCTGVIHWRDSLARLVRSAFRSGPALRPRQRLRCGENIDPPISIEAMRADQQTTLADFEDRFRRLMREHGIEVGNGIVLTANEQGQVTVSNEHPQKSAVEQLFRDNPDLRAQFVQLTRQATVLRAADLSGELVRLQADSPEDSAQHVSQLLRSSANGSFFLTIRPGDIVADFK